MDFLNDLTSIIIDSINALGVYGTIVCCFFILIESMIPIIPLAVFFTINFLAFGNIIGFIISWIFTIGGCVISFMLCRNKIKTWFDSKPRIKKSAKKLMNYLEGISFSKFVVLISIPFFPAFLINIASGLSNMSFRKFLTAICIGKIFLVYFWGYIGTSLIQSIENPIILFKVFIMVIIAYVISKFVNQKVKID